MLLLPASCSATLAGSVPPAASSRVPVSSLRSAGYLAGSLCGREQVGPLVQVFATSMVVSGTLMSAFCLRADNSLMQTLAGCAINE